MRTRRVVDDEVVEEGFPVFSLPTHAKPIDLEMVQAALEENEALDIRDLRGAGGVLPDYDHKLLREDQ